MYQGSSPSADRRAAGAKLRIMLLGLVALNLAGLLVYRHGPWRAAARVERSTPGSLSVDERLRLEHQKNVAIGYLESGVYDEADRRLAEIAYRLPQERLGLQNLAICRLLAFESDQGQAAVAMESVNQLMDQFPESASARLLASRVHLTLAMSTSSAAKREQYLAAALEVLQRAVDLELSSPVWRAVPRYAFYQAARWSADPAVKSQARTFLEEAYRQDSENLFVIVDWLAEQAQMQDRAITNTLQSARQTLEPCRDSIRRRTGKDVFEFIDLAAAAALATDWPTVVAHTRVIGHMVRPEAYAQSDKRRIAPHPLEFVIHAFGESFYRGLPREAAGASRETIVRLVPLPTAQQPPPLTDVRDLVVADMDLDGTDDLVVLHRDRLSVLRRDPAAGTWSPLFEGVLPAGMRGILLADLDRDERVSPQAGEGRSREASSASPVMPAGGDELGSREADPDVIVYGEPGAWVFRNDLGAAPEPRVLTAVDQGEGFLSLSGIRCGLLIDLDEDGDLDLVLAAASGTSIWINAGDLTFLDISRWSALPPPDCEFACMSAVDWDRDADLDVLMTGPGENSTGMLERTRHGRFQWQPLRRRLGRVTVRPESGALLDDDGNGSWDLAVAGDNGLQLIRTRSLRPRIITLLDRTLVDDRPCRLLATWDCDNDGHTDLLISSVGGVAVLRGGLANGFVPAAGIFSPPPAAASRGVPADLDADGDLDLAVCTPAGVVLYTNEGGNRNHWLKVRVQGKLDRLGGGVNHDGLGSELILQTGAACQAQVVTGPVTHFGLGQTERADVLRVLLTGGGRWAFVEPQADRTIGHATTCIGSRLESRGALW